MNWIQSSRCDSNHCLQVGWQKSSRSDANGNCLEARWQKSRRCDTAKCVEVALRGQVLVRDSKLLDRATDTYHGPILSFDPHDWDTFIKNLPVKA